MKTVTRHCRLCRKLFTIPASRRVGKFCSIPCRSRYTSLHVRGTTHHRWNRIKKSCVICHRLFEIVASQNPLRKTCGHPCLRLYYQSIKRGPQHGNFKRYRFLTKPGYYRVYVPDHPHADCYGHVAEHRLIMEKHLGRFLDPQEVIHHLNHKKGDNRLSNLLLMKNDAEHTALHNHLRFTHAHRLPQHIKSR